MKKKETYTAPEAELIPVRPERPLLQSGVTTDTDVSDPFGGTEENEW